MEPYRASEQEPGCSPATPRTFTAPDAVRETAIAPEDCGSFHLRLAAAHARQDDGAGREAFTLSGGVARTLARGRWDTFADNPAFGAALETDR